MPNARRNRESNLDYQRIQEATVGRAKLAIDHIGTTLNPVE
jgi:hypothetical protein